MTILHEGRPRIYLDQLEAIRRQLVHTVLEIREVCETASDTRLNGTTAVCVVNAQRLLSAAVNTLLELDGRLHEARKQLHHEAQTQNASGLQDPSQTSTDCPPDSG